MLEKAFENNFKRLFRPLCMYSLHYVHDMDAAEDIVEECFVQLLQKFFQTDGGKLLQDDIPDGVNVAAYMHAAVRNRSIDYLRKLRPEIPDAEFLYPDNETDGYGLSFDEDAFDGSREEARIWEALERLPEKRRQIFIMSRRDGMSHEEIAEELGISVRTVTNQISRALRTFDQQKFTKVLALFF